MNDSVWMFSYEVLLYPLLRAFLQLAALANEKVREGLRLRRPVGGRAPWTLGPQGTRPIWFHCASGEFEYAKPVIREIKRRQPALPILVTYFSPSVRSAVSKFPGVDMSSPAPWDQRAAIADLIRHHQPRALLIARTDTWPAMLHEAHRAGIPSLLFSATFAEGASRLKPLARSFTAWTLSQLSAIYCVSEADRARVSTLPGAPPVTVAGDTRFDQALARLGTELSDQPRRLQINWTGGQDGLDQLANSAPRLLVAGSTWPPDEAQLIPCLASLRGSIKAFIAPHEPTDEHLIALEARLTAAGLRHIRYSRADRQQPNRLSIAADIDTVVVDQVGILAELYPLGEFAFVGGSFKKKVHSVMEPLAAGCVTFVGPHHQNNREALDFKTIQLPSPPSKNPRDPRESLTCVCEVGSSQMWQMALQNALHTPAGAWRDFIRGQIQARSGRSRLVADWVFENQLP